LREEADEGKEGDGIFSGFQLSAVAVDGVAEGLEGIEADAHGQNNIEGADRGFGTQQGKGIDEILGEEVIVFEEAEEAQVDDDAREQQEASFGGGLCYQKSAAYEIVHQRAEGDEREKTPVPPAVKKVAGYDDEQILDAEIFFENEPIQDKYDRKEECKFYRVEEHGGDSSRQFKKNDGREVIMDAISIAIPGKRDNWLDKNELNRY
jgi:hypothetical protein